ncbi:MAG: sigma-70 family RNA polymerase sigma factor [Cyclobacteriaceae bacterium]
MELSLTTTGHSPGMNMIKSAQSDFSDNELWTAFQAGDRLAFEEIYNSSINYLTNYAMRVVSDKNLAQDAIQDVFVDLWNNRKNLASVNSIRFYLLKSVRRDLIRKKIKEDKKSPLSSLGKNKIDFQPSYEMLKVLDEESSERVLKMRKMMDTLTPKQKEVLYLKYYSNMTNQEISDILEINMQSVYNNIYRALEVLRDKLHVFIPWLVLHGHFFEG